MENHMSEVNRELFKPTRESIGQVHHFIPNPIETLRPVFNLQKAQYTVLGSNTGVGKAIYDEEMVLTPRGWVRHGSLKRGNMVIGSDGLYTEVLEVFPQGQRLLFEVEFQDGTTVMCDGDHLWKVMKVNEDEEVVVTTSEMFHLGVLSYDVGSSYKYSIPMCKPIHQAPLEWPAANLVTTMLSESIAEREMFIDSVMESNETINNVFIRSHIVDIARSLGYLVVNRPTLHINKTATRKFITKITPKGHGTCTCIKVAAEDSLYVVNGYNLTHNTSFVDHMILSALKIHSQELHVEALYYSMERKKRFKFAKWISWAIKDISDVRISSDKILNRDGALTKEGLDKIESRYRPWLEDVMQYIDLREGGRTVEQIEHDIDRMALRLGNYFYSDDTTIYKNNKIAVTFDENQFIMTKFGKRLFKNLNFKGKEYVLYQNDSLYVPLKESLIFIVIDHIGKVKIGTGGKKMTLDRLDDVLSNARDKYSFSPIAISQFNRSIGETERLKLQKGDKLSPTLEDFKDTGNLTESADVVLSLFDPERYKAYNAEGEYKGYNIRDKMVTPAGQQRARTLHVLKNTFGYANTTTVLRFTGESMYFSTLPRPTETIALDKVYKEIANGK